MQNNITPLYLFGETFTIDIKHDSEYINGTFNIIEKSNGIVIISNANITNNKFFDLYCKWVKFCINEKFI